MKIKPYSDDGLNKIYNLLFCDDISLYNSDKSNLNELPWKELLSEKPSIAALQKITTDANTESRAKILAHHRLNLLGQQSGNKELLGVIIEVGIEDGLDTLAAYKDGSARYINHSEKLVVWEANTEQSQELIKELLVHSLYVVKNIGPWNKERLPNPRNGEIRLSFLVAGELYFGQGPFEVLQNDSMGGPVINAATQFMVFLINQRQPATAEN